MNEFAREINAIIEKKSPTLYALLSNFGRNIYMPKGIIMQSAEANKYSFKYNASIGIAKEKGEPMYLASLKKFFNNLKPSQIFPYASPYGVPELRALWQDKIVSENTLIENNDAISLPVVTQALTNGLMLSADLFIDKDDEIYITDKMWDNYPLIFETRYNAKIMTYPLFNKGLTGLDIDALDSALAKSTKEKIILLFNFPNNPTGYTITGGEAKEIVQVVLKYAERGKKILIISDDSYYGLFYEEGLIEGSIFSNFANIHPNIVSIKIDGYTKEYYVWGFRVGFITFADYYRDREVYNLIEQKTAAAIRCSISNCSLTKQSILLSLKDNKEYMEEKNEKFKILKERALRVKEIVYDSKYSDCWDVYPFNSGYFMCLRIKGVDSNSVRERALKDYGVGTISLGEYDLRVAFSCVELEQLDDIFEIIARAVRDLKKD